MHDLFDSLSDNEIQAAKSRIWKRMEPKLEPQMLSQLRRASSEASASRLLRVQAKERLLDILPERKKQPSYFSKVFRVFFEKRVWSVATLSFFFAFLFAPLFQFSPMASAGASNVLEVVQGSARVLRAAEIIEVENALILYEGDRVQTEEGAMAHIQFIDDSRMTLGPNSDVLLTELFVNPGNTARTEIVVDQFSGQVWSQVVNLVSSDSFFALRYPDGELVARQRASFDVNVTPDQTEVSVARNLIDIIALADDLVHQGTLGQGTFMIVSDGVETGVLSADQLEDAWWTFNLSYGKFYAQTLDERYKKASEDLFLLPGNPFYPLKSLQEDMQELVTVTDEGKQKLALKRADSRLSEAKALMALGEDEKAEQVLDEYDKSMDKVADLLGSDELAAHLEQTKKSLFAGDDQNNKLIETRVDAFEQDLSLSSKLMRVPDLIEAGDYETAMAYLTEYKDGALSRLVELETIPLEEREALVQEMLDQKLKDLQMLRVIAAMPELNGVFDVDTQVIQEMSLVVLSLRERQLDHLSDFVQTERDAELQYELYDRLKDSVELTPEVDEQLEILEEQAAQLGPGAVVLELTTSGLEVDPRLSYTHADEAEDESESGGDGTENPEAHDNL